VIVLLDGQVALLQEMEQFLGWQECCVNKIAKERRATAAACRRNRNRRYLTV
jgi:hypothetical protein